MRGCWRYLLVALLFGALCGSTAAQEGGNPFLQDREFNPYAEKFATHEDSIRASWFWYEKGRRDEARGGMQVDKALDAYTRAAELNPRNFDVHCRRADILLKYGRYYQAASALRQALSLEPGRTDLWVKLADALAQSGMRDEAIVALDSVLAGNPESSDLWLKKAKLCSTPDRLRECVAAYEQVIRFDPDNKEHYLELAGVCGGKGWVRKANEVWDTIHRRWPEDIEIWDEHGMTLVQACRWQELVTLMDRALAIHPDNVSLRLLKLGGLASLRMTGNMEEESREILARDSTRETRSAVYHTLECTYERTRQWNKALAAANELVAAAPDEGWVWRIRGNLGEKAGRTPEEQLADFDSAIVYEPREADGVPYFPDSWVEKCGVLAKLGRTDEALAILDSLIAMKSDWAYVWQVKAYVLAEAGDCSDALSTIEQALELDPRDSWSQRFKSELLDSLGLQGADTASHESDRLMLLPEPFDSLTRVRVDSAWKAVLSATSKSDSDAALQQFNLLFHEATLPKNLDTARVLTHLLEDPESSDELQANAMLLAYCGKFAEAEEALTRAIKMNPMNAGLWCDRARVRAELGKRNEAIEDLIEAVDIDPRYRHWVQGDPGFRNIWNDSLFMGIVSGER